jgi:hypothetical protein
MLSILVRNKVLVDPVASLFGVLIGEYPGISRLVLSDLKRRVKLLLSQRVFKL